MKTLLLAGIFLLASCGENTQRVNAQGGSCSVSTYGPGVFYFHCTGAFGTALAEFRKTHEVISISSYAPAGNFGTTGYWVITR